MRIRSLEITGFKSFGERTVLAFGAGISGIVGPNGCGKSNIIDALRWVMGEQNPRHLRGRAMEDLIFAGTVKRVGGLTGYGLAYEPFAAGLAGEVVLYRINPGVSLTDIGSQQVSLDPAKDYRFVLELSGSTIHGQVFEIGGGLVAERFATDATYASGFSGVLGYGQTPVTPPTDFTMDNFQVVPEPSVSLLVGLGLVGLVAIHRWRRKRA